MNAAPDDHLRDLMQRSSDGDPTSPADPHALARLARGRRTRRTVVASAAFAAASIAVAGTVLAQPGSSGGQSEPPVASDGKPPEQSRGEADGGYERVVVSEQEAIERCETVLSRRAGQPVDVSAVSARSGRELVEGDRAGARLVTGAGSTSPQPQGDSHVIVQLDCVIPAAAGVDTAGTFPEPLPDADDAAGIRAACGQYVGYDLSGWDVLTADHDGDSLGAILRSSDDHVAQCLIDPYEQYGSSAAVDQRPAGPRPTRPSPDAAPAYRVYVDCRLPGRGHPDPSAYDCVHMDRMAGPEEPATIEVTGPGVDHQVPVVDGWYAISLALPLEQMPNPYGPAPLTFTVLDADGEVLASYSDGDDAGGDQVTDPNGPDTKPGVRG